MWGAPYARGNKGVNKRTCIIVTMTYESFFWIILGDLLEIVEGQNKLIGDGFGCIRIFHLTTFPKVSHACAYDVS